MPAPKGNKFALGNKGRSKKFKSSKELQEKIDEYFHKQDTFYIEEVVGGDIRQILKPKPYTIEGLCILLDCDRQTLLNYEKQKGYEEFFDVLRKAKRKVFNNWTEGGINGTHNSNFTKFIMTNNTEYSDKKETDITTAGDKLDTKTVINVNLADRIEQLKDN